jgi:hypothetical protein
LPPVHPSHPRLGSELNGNLTALVRISAGVLTPNFRSLGGMNFGGGELSPQIQAGSPSNENVYGGPTILLGGGDLGVLIIAPDGVVVVGPWGPQAGPGELAATSAGLAGLARRAARRIHPVDLAKVKAQLSKELHAIRAAVLHGRGLTFTSRDLMISVVPGGGFGNLCEGCSNDVSCQVTVAPCDATEYPDPGDPWRAVINPGEVRELQALLKQAVLQNPALSGGQR